MGRDLDPEKSRVGDPGLTRESVLPDPRRDRSAWVNGTIVDHTAAQRPAIAATPNQTVTSGGEPAGSRS
jgi:hypothetical protein